MDLQMTMQSRKNLHQLKWMMINDKCMDGQE